MQGHFVVIPFFTPAPIYILVLVLQVKQVNPSNGCKIDQRKLYHQEGLPADQPAYTQGQNQQYCIGKINIQPLFFCHLPGGDPVGNDKHHRPAKSYQEKRMAENPIPYALRRAKGQVFIDSQCPYVAKTPFVKVSKSLVMGPVAVSPPVVRRKD